MFFGGTREVNDLKKCNDCHMIEKRGDCMKLTYIQHSGFAIELAHSVLIFDYATGVMPRFPKEKTIYVFVSHNHNDHYNKEIMELEKWYPSLYFIMDEGVPVQESETVIKVTSHTTYDVKECHIETLTSTDEGVAFIVTVEHTIIYHAGDLHWWDWGCEDTPFESQQMEQAFKAEMKRISNRQFDVAFVPVDPRLHSAYDKGIRYFMHICDTTYVVPMHFWNDYSIFHKMRKLPFFKKVVVLEKENSTFIL